MFKLPYFYYFIAAWFLVNCLQRVQRQPNCGEKMKGVYSTVVFGLCTISLIVFLVLGFWFMPKWWYPLAFLGCSIVAAIIPLSDRIGAILALVAAPVLCVLAYLSLFGVI